MFDNASEKQFYMSMRLMHMNMMLFYLNMYKDTGKEVYLERAKIFGAYSNEMKKDLEKLSTG